MADTKKKPTCKYGAKCYRKNEKHLKEFHHPAAEEKEFSSKRSMKEEEDKEEPQTKKTKTIDQFFGTSKKSKTSNENSSEDKQNGTESKAPVIKQGNTSGYVRQKKKEPEEDSNCSEDSKSQDNSPPSPTDVRENIKQKFLVKMPDDFYDFWEFAKSINKNKPQAAFKKSLGLELVGPFDILAGKSAKKNSKGKRPNYLRHWRYYYDPPEFLTVVKGDDLSQFHMGYFRDDPKELPVFVASNAAKENCTISPRGENIFAAVSWFIDAHMKKHKASKAELTVLKEKLCEFAKSKDYSLDARTKMMKARDKKVVCKSFHGAGIVVPVDENEIGYREVPETPADLKKMFKKIVESKNDEEKAQNFDPLMELITLVQFANDECDYGQGLELGMDLFCYGHNVFNNTIRNLLPLAYQLLGRSEFKQIIESHLEDRKHSAELSELD